MKPNAQTLLIVGAVGLIGYLLLRKVTVQGAAKAAADAAASAVAGGVIGIGQQFGIPETNLTKGEQDIANGDWWDASFDLPAGQFLTDAGGAILNDFSSIGEPADPYAAAGASGDF